MVQVSFPLVTQALHANRDIGRAAGAAGVFNCRRSVNKPLRGHGRRGSSAADVQRERLAPGRSVPRPSPTPANSSGNRCWNLSNTRCIRSMFPMQRFNNASRSNTSEADDCEACWPAGSRESASQVLGIGVMTFDRRGEGLVCCWIVLVLSVCRFVRRRSGAATYGQRAR